MGDRTIGKPNAAALADLDIQQIDHRLSFSPLPLPLTPPLLNEAVKETIG